MKINRLCASSCSDIRWALRSYQGLTLYRSQYSSGLTKLGKQKAQGLKARFYDHMFWCVDALWPGRVAFTCISRLSSSPSFFNTYTKLSNCQLHQPTSFSYNHHFYTLSTICCPTSNSFKHFVATLDTNYTLLERQVPLLHTRYEASLAL